MIRQEFNIEHYWEVIIYYDVEYPLFAHIVKDLNTVGASTENIKNIYDTMKSGNAKAVTFSNLENHISIILFNYHDSKEDYINSIVHEAEHVKQAMLEVYNVKDRGEAPAYTIGHLMSKMYQVFAHIICDCKSHSINHNSKRKYE